MIAEAAANSLLSPAKELKAPANSPAAESWSLTLAVIIFFFCFANCLSIASVSIPANFASFTCSS